MALKIKKDFLNTVIAYNNSGIPLKDRTEKDLIDLAIMAQESGDPTLLILFEGELPTVDSLKKSVMAQAEKVVKAGGQGEKDK